MTGVFPSVPKTVKRFCAPFSITVILSITYSLDSDYNILHLSLNEHNQKILGVSTDWFKSYLSNRSQYVSIKRYESGFAAIICGVPQGSVPGSVPFLLYINDFNQGIKFCKVHHIANDTNLLCLSNSIKKLKPLVNADLKQLVN